MTALYLSIELILMIGVGFVVWRLGLVDEKFDESLTSFIINISLPCMIIKSFDAPFSIQDLNNCLILLLISVVVLALSFGIGQICYKLCRGGYSGRIMRFGVMFTNFTFVGMPVVEQLYGQTGLLYFVVFIVPMRMVYYSAAKPLLSPPGIEFEKESVWQHIKGWLSPPVIAVFIGLALYISQIRLPVVVDDTISGIGSVCSPLGMILCGLSLGKHKLGMLMNVRYLRLPLLRNFLMPALTIALLYFLPLDPLVAKVVVIFSALPVASLLAAFTIQYDPEPGARLESAGSVLFSIIACAVTIPLWAYMADILFV